MTLWPMMMNGKLHNNNFGLIDAPAITEEIGHVDRKIRFNVGGKIDVRLFLFSTWSVSLTLYTSSHWDWREICFSFFGDVISSDESCSTRIVSCPYKDMMQNSQGGGRSVVAAAALHPKPFRTLSLSLSFSTSEPPNLLGYYPVSRTRHFCCADRRSDLVARWPLRKWRLGRLVSSQRFSLLCPLPLKVRAWF